jgi:hypothetical protein
MGNAAQPSSTTRASGLSDTQFLEKVAFANTFGCPNLFNEASSNSQVHDPNEAAMISAMYASCLTAHVNEDVKKCLPELSKLDGNVEDKDVQSMLNQTLTCVTKYEDEMDSVVQRLGKLANTSQKVLMPDAARFAEEGSNEIRSQDSNEIVKAKFSRALDNCNPYTPQNAQDDERFFTLCIMANNCATSYKRCYDKNQNELDECLQKDPYLQDCLKRIREAGPPGK